VLGVAAGVLATLLAVGFTQEQMGQFAILVAAGGGLGLAIGRRVSPMQLPQTVAALHSVVGLAAVMTSAASVLAMGEGHATGLHLTTAYLGVLIGGITFTGKSLFVNPGSGSPLKSRLDPRILETGRSNEFSPIDTARPTLDQFYPSHGQLCLLWHIPCHGPYSSGHRCNVFGGERRVVLR
jgi:hypothetical protein